jgi:hypothetical protein
MHAFGDLGLKTIVVRDARVRHYGWVGLNPGSAMVRATANHGAERVRHRWPCPVFGFHVVPTPSGLPKCSAVGIFLPIWVVLTSLGCLRADATWTDQTDHGARAVAVLACLPVTVKP